MTADAHRDDAPAGVRPRRYDSPLRRQRAAETRDRIVTAGADLARTFPSWDWGDLTFRAVAERARVGERTVYRHFPTERHLHDAVMQRLEEDAGVSYDGMTLDAVALVAGRVFASLGSFSVTPRALAAADSTIGAEDDRRRDALRRAVDEAKPHWVPARRESTAAALDVLWSMESYERLIAQWGFTPDQATDVLAWLIGLSVDAIERDGPPAPRRARD
jgi:AcrR family transcriptional regulator